MQSSTTTTLPTRTRPFESQQHPLAKTHWSMLHRRVRKARGPWFNCYKWGWMMSSSRTSPSRSLPFSSRDTFLTHPSCPQNFVAPRAFPNDKTRARLRRERFAADWPIWPLQAACTLMVGRDLARVRCSCVPCIALGALWKIWNLPSCAAALLPDRLSAALVIDRSRPWKGGLWMNPIITYSAVPTCICLFPLTHQTTILRTRRRVVQDRLAAVAQYCICVAYMGLRSGVIKHNMGLLDFTSHHATPRYRSAQLHESTIDPNVLHEKPR